MWGFAGFGKTPLDDQPHQATDFIYFIGHHKFLLDANTADSGSANSTPEPAQIPAATLGASGGDSHVSIEIGIK